MEEPESPSKTDILSLKEEFFQVLNLQATKRIKVKYCRTIKERLRFVSPLNKFWCLGKKIIHGTLKRGNFFLIKYTPCF